MVLKSYSFMPKEIDISFYYDIHEEIQNLKWYFYKFAGVHAEEAMQKTIYHTLMHFNAEKGNLSAYVKKLAREITKENSRLVLVDFLEQTLSDDEDDSGMGGMDIGNISDFSSTLLDELEMAEDRYGEVVNLALEFMDKFLMLCEALIKHDTSTKYYPDVFIKNCLKINKKCPNFNKLCLDVYMEHKDDFEWFIGLSEDDEEGCWKEPDFVLIGNSYSKRIKFVNPQTGLDVENADLEPYVLSGKLGTGNTRKRVIKINYLDLWEHFCDLIDDTDTNELKFVIGDSYICRTFGGSLSVLNPDLYNMYDVVRMEILTNILQDTYGRILNIGSDCIYLVCNSTMNKTELNRTVHNYPIHLVYEDITDSLV